MPVPIRKRVPVTSAPDSFPKAKGPGVQSFDGTKNTDANQPPIKHPDWQGPGVVLDNC
jgi:hypothetical protein